MYVVQVFMPKFYPNASVVTEDIEVQEIEEKNKVLLIITAFLILCPICVSAASVVFALVSWTALPRWRSFRHYAFMNVLFTNTLGVLLLSTIETPHSILLLGFFIDTAFAHWLTVLTVMFYNEFVKVFMKIDHVYMKANIFGWVLPVAWTLLEAYFNDLIYYLCVVVVFVNVMVYLNVLRVLLRSRKNESRQHILTRVMLSTFAFVTTGGVWWLPLLLRAQVRCAIMIPAFSICYFITMMTINVFFLSLKAHRVLWREHWLRKETDKLNKMSIEKPNTDSAEISCDSATPIKVSDGF